MKNNKRTIILELVLIISLTLITVFASEAKEKNRTRLAAPPMKVKPVIDGAINPEEWRYALKLSGLTSWEGDVETRKCDLWIGYDFENMYFAVRSEMPPGGKLVAKSNGESKYNNPVLYDDSINFYIVPPERKEPGSYRFGYFQLWINSEGQLYTRHMDPGYGLLPCEWQLKFQQAHSFGKDNFWEAEIAIPLNQMGINKLELPSEWKILFCRNFKNPWTRPVITALDRMDDINNYAIFVCDDKAQVVQIECCTDDKKHPLLNISVFNPSPEKVTVNSEIKFSPDNASDNIRKVELELEPETGTVYSAGNNIDNSKEYSCEVKIANNSGVVDYYRKINFKPQNVQVWDNREAFLKFRHSFDKTAETADKAPTGTENAIHVKGTLTQVAASSQELNRAFYFPKGSELLFSRKIIAVPGTVSCWICFGNKNLGSGGKRILWSEKNSRGRSIALIQKQDTVYLETENTEENGKGSRSVKTCLSPDKRWINFCVVLDKNRIVLIVDGLECGQIDLKTPLNASQFGDFKIASATDGINDFEIAKLEIYRKPLSIEEINEMVFGKSVPEGKISYFPSIKELIVEFKYSTSVLPSKTFLSLEVVNLKTAKIILEKKLDIIRNTLKTPSGMTMLRERVSLPELEDGEYQTFVRIGSLTQMEYFRDILKRTFKVKKYPWEKNKIGKSDIIIPPFTPLLVDGKNVSCILRTYKVGIEGFPEQIISNGESILAGPIECIVATDTKQMKWKPVDFKFIEKKPTKVEYEAESENELLKMKVRGEFDYDGFLKLTLNFSPSPIHKDKEINRIYIDIPVKENIAKLFHAIGNRIRHNPAGNIPEGKGKVWGSRSITQPDISNFIPYLWIGEEERGICYAADWDKNWVHCSERDAIEVIRKGDSVVIRLNLINGLVLSEKGREIELAVMASPVKPMPRGWRGWVDNAATFEIPGTRYLQGVYTNSGWGNYYGWASFYPSFKDYTFISKLDETRNTGKIDQCFVKDWLKRVEEAPLFEVPWRENGPGRHRDMEWLKHVVKAYFGIMQKLSRTEPKGEFYLYTCMASSYDGLPEYETYRDEWEYLNRGHTVQSYRDYAAYYAAQLIEHGADGIYLDNSFFEVKYSWPTDDGYIDNEGKIHPSLGLWRIRNHVKRLATMMAEHGRSPFISVHNTNANNLAGFSFATNTMGMEWKYGNTDFQERFTPDYIRAVNIGRQGGFFPTALDGLKATKSNLERVWLTRTMLAVLLPHEIQPTAGIGTEKKTYKRIAEILWNFGKGKSDTEFYPYWEKDTPIKTQSKELIISAYKNANRLMLVAGNYGGDMEIPIQINCNKLGFKRIKEASNAETGEKVQSGESEIQMKVRKHDLSLIEISME